MEPSDIKQGRDKACLVCYLLTAARGKAHRSLCVIYVALNDVGVCSGPSTTQSIPLSVLQDSTVRSYPHFLLTICRLRITQSEGCVARIELAIFLLFAQLTNACKVGYVRTSALFYLTEIQRDYTIAVLTSGLCYQGCGGRSYSLYGRKVK